MQNEQLDKMPAQLATNRSEAQKDSTIESIALECHRDVSLVRDIYESTYERLAQHAKVKTFLPLITARVVRVALQEEVLGTTQ